MIITAMANWRPAPGEMLEWRPTIPDTPDRARAVGVHAVPASFLQANHVRGVDAAQRRGDRHTGFLGSATEVEGDLDAAALTRAIAVFLARHEGLRTWFSVRDGAVQRHRAPADAALVPVEAGAAATTDSAREAVRDRLSRDATPLSWPPVAIGAIRRHGSFSLYYGADHAFSDGASQVTVIAELADLYRAEVTGTPALDLTEHEGSFLDHVRIEEEVSPSYDLHSPELADWIDVVSRHDGGLPRFPLDLGLAPGETAPMEPVERDLLTAAEADVFEQVCRDAGGSFTSGLFAACALVEHELAGTGRYDGIAVLSTRHRGPFALSQGWFCAFSPVTFPVDDADEFADVLRSATAAYARAKTAASVPIGRVLELLATGGVGGAGLARSPQLLSYLDFRRFPGSGTPADECAVLFTGEGRTANASMWFNRDHRHFYVGAQIPSTPTARRAVRRYHDRLIDLLVSVVRSHDTADPAVRSHDTADVRCA
ncbi:Condensation domain-containing protein [Rhodococcoides kroppenstedtii]|uniref:Condensation domain-containing protein n=1 Tax=Rhodococcoides kroppenstedtii TaxID=293050 RepID=A0A1I0SSC2_9NOCA|nr:condensation domain-containing protein [Rhodococcus kroppenstedtii]SFA42391.1 Condensation domain-containing protein [Rhodococcus kroppenstedtii]